MPTKRTSLSAAFAAFLLAGCFTYSGPPASTITASDSGVLVPTIRASVGGQGPGAPSEARDGHAVEVSWSRASGGDQQALAAGQAPVRFGSQTFSGPAQLQHDFDYRFLEVAYRFRHFFGGDVGIEALAGFAHANLDLTVASGAQRATEAIDSAGFVASFGIIGRLRPGTSVQGRATLFGSGSSSGVSEAQRFELALAQSVWRHAALRAGYVFWRVDSERENSGTSPVRVKFSGPTLGLDLAF
ncbi:MAG: hypothetical protein ACREUO_05410 [Burkholderiales bacterium]